MKNLSFWILLFFIGCTLQEEDIPKHIRGLENLIVYSEDLEPKASIEMVRETSLEVPDNILLNWYDNPAGGYGWLAGIEIDDAGRVFIADLGTLKIHKFDSDGNYLMSKGGEGSGPGEYYTITDTEIVSKKLHVFDFMQFRTTIYSLDSLQVAEAKNVRPPTKHGRT